MIEIIIDHFLNSDRKHDSERIFLKILLFILIFFIIMVHYGDINLFSKSEKQPKKVENHWFNIFFYLFNFRFGQS